MNEKVCTGCKISKPYTEFYKCKSYKDGYNYKCKKCIYTEDIKIKNRDKKLPISGKKICCRCKIEQPISEYVRKLRSSDGLRHECKNCMHSDEKKYRKAHIKESYLRKIKQKYNIDPQVFLNLCEKQNQRCFICNKECKLVVDHCHKTLQFRGLLCNLCNVGLGSFKDNIENLEKAISYLRDFYERLGLSTHAFSL